MTMTPEEALAMARECAAEAKEGSFTAHLAPECIEEIREGGHDDWEEVQSALLAIDRMQERVRAEGLVAALEKTQSLVAKCCPSGFKDEAAVRALYKNNGAICDALTAYRSASTMRDTK